MMVKCKLLVLLLLLAGAAGAQVTLGLQVPPTGVVQKSQLWNMVLVNGSNASCDVDVTITLSSAADNNPVMTATGKLITLTKGARQLKYADFAPVNYKYLSGMFNNDMRPEGFLPVGAYTVCYTVSRWKGDLQEPVAEDCINIEIQPLSPPVLNTPADKEVLTVRTPQFTWLPPAPLQLFGDLSYDLVITRVMDGQSALSAIQQNIPVYNTGRSKNNFLNYPASYTSLDTGVTYAWCVVARNNNQFAAQSDVWTFTVQSAEKQRTDKAGSAYIKLRRDENGALAVTTGQLLIAYTNEAGDAKVSYVVRPLEEVKDRSVIMGELPVKGGQNTIDIAASVVKQLESGKSYLLELFNSRNECWRAKFIYYNSKP